MSQIHKRIMKLEESKFGGPTYVALTFGRNTKPTLPDDIGDREVLVLRIVFAAEPVRDATGKILNPDQDVDDDDPCYERIRKRFSARLKY